MVMDAAIARDGSQGSRKEMDCRAQGSSMQGRKDCQSLWRLLLYKAVHPFELCGDREEAKGSPAPGPLLSHSMTAGPGLPVNGVVAGGRGERRNLNRPSHGMGSNKTRI
jgi:hypothetical protein